MHKKILDCKDLKISYKNNVIIENLSFSVDEGDFFLILGKNGCGKSTLLKSILNLKEISKGEIKKNFKYSGYVSQEILLKKDFPSTVLEFVLSSRAINKLFFTSTDKKIVFDNLKKLDLFEIRNKSLSSLSIGQRQRVLVCRSLCVCEKIIFLDEPTNSLDINSQENFYKILEKLNKENLTIVMITHDKKAFKYANKALVLSKMPKVFFNVFDAYKKGEIDFD